MYKILLPIQVPITSEIFKVAQSGIICLSQVMQTYLSVTGLCIINMYHVFAKSHFITLAKSLLNRSCDSKNILHSAR